MININNLKFKGYVLENINKTLKLYSFKNQKKLQYGQVLVKIFYSGVCGKQVEEYTGKMGKDKFLPHLLGHEASGKIIDKHRSVKHVKINDIVVAHWMKNKKGIQSKVPEFYYKNNKKLNAGWITTFSNYSILSSNRVTKIPKDSDLKKAALLGCCLSTGIGTILNQSKPKKKDNIAVIGCGGIGLSTLIGLNIAKIKNIDCFDVKLKNLDKAKILGAKSCYLIKDFNFKKKYNKIYVSTGNLKAVAFANKVGDLKSDIYLMGVPSPKSDIKLNALDIHKGKNFLSSSGGEINPHKDINKFLKKIKQKRLKVNKLILNVQHYSKLPDIIKKLSKGEISHGRNLINFKNLS